MNDENPDRSQFLHQIDLIRQRRVLGKSDMLNRLFEYLVQTSLDGRSPKEVEIAEAVFARDTNFDVMQDASVRVYVHRLRTKLADFYMGPGADEPGRLIMLKGEYRLVLDTIDSDPIAADAAPPPAIASVVRHRRLPLIAATLLALVVLGVIGWLGFVRPDGPDRDLAAVRSSALWGPVVASGQPIVVVLGDYYIFGEADSSGEVKRLVREYNINSRYDLDEHVMQHPELNGRYIDLSLHYYPIGVATALRDILPILRTEGRRVHQVRVIPASELTSDMLRIGNIVYIGYLSGLGALRNPVFNGSRYSIGPSYDDLIDKRGGPNLVATTARPDQVPEQDFAYISRFPGPNGTNIVIIAGTRDAGVMQAAEYASQRATAEALKPPTNSPDAFEALLKVDTLGAQNLAGKLLTLSGIDRNRIWRSAPPQHFPDDERTTPQP